MRKKRDRHGQGFVEFALILPVLLLIIVGIMEFGHLFIVYASLTNASREGTRYGIVSPTDYDGINTR
ncbi:MAG: pilus assembly protein, partial [Chloroflexi bacterium]|nr:pilus assembly protein [Chloroflexota bacterium]